jgi:hypothetical protein
MQVEGKKARERIDRSEMYARAAKKGASERESELVSRVRGEGEGERNQGAHLHVAA